MKEFPMIWQKIAIISLLRDAGRGSSSSRCIPGEVYCLMKLFQVRLSWSKFKGGEVVKSLSEDIIRPLVKPTF